MFVIPSGVENVPPKEKPIRQVARLTNKNRHELMWRYQLYSG
jgi:hypothetical protein